jgi:uncharacterized protein with NAD-binding domain and iron-sulfur cluster
MTTKPIEVAVIGGGCAGMAAAFELTGPHQQGKYHVTIYQLGWRLGGKGASGRGPSDRIEEHGLHLWMGFYENAFRLMRECYAENARDPATCRLADWRDAFAPDNFNAVADLSPPGAWLPWKVRFPPLPGLPGDPSEAARRRTVADYVARVVLFTRTLLETIQVRAGAAPQAAAAASAQRYPTVPSDVLEGISRFLRLGQLGTFGALLEALRLLEVAVAAFPAYPENLIVRFHEAISTAVRAQLEALIVRDNELRRMWEILDLTFALVRGAMRFRLLTHPHGFDAVDEYDCREWLLLNGASKRSVDSAFVRALYDLGFSYEEGNTARPRIAAGQAIRGVVRAFFTYRGAFFWKMQAGMGDAVFAPLWEVLRKRGVRFEFFHRLEDVRVGDGEPGERPHVEALEFDVQATVEGKGEYEPLVDVRGLACWPSKPDYAQLVDGDRFEREAWEFESHWDRRAVGRKTLNVGVDFDFVVLAVGLGAVPHVAPSLLARDARWRAMVEHVKTVPTQAFQIWSSRPMTDFGWSDGPVNVSGFVEPFDTWADMSHLASQESHATPVRAIAYFCSVLPDAPPDVVAQSAYPGERSEEVRKNAIHFLNHDIVHIWPKATKGDAFRWDTLVPVGSESAQGRAEARFDGQYWRANVNPSDRYVLSLPGTLCYRISPLDTRYDNLTIAGDWTDCGFNEGCVEAAVMSGRLASHALSEWPPLEQIVGYDHP